MRHTAVQRRLLKEDGALDYGASLSGSPSGVTQATPPGAPTHAPGGAVGEVTPDNTSVKKIHQRSDVRDVVSTVSAIQNTKEAMIKLEQASVTLRTANQGASGSEAQLLTQMSTALNGALESIKSNLIEYSGNNTDLSHLVNILLDSKYSVDQIEAIANNAFS